MTPLQYILTVCLYYIVQCRLYYKAHKITVKPILTKYTTNISMATERHPNAGRDKSYNSLTLNLLYIYRFWQREAMLDLSNNQNKSESPMRAQWEPDSFFVLNNTFELEVNIFFWAAHKIGTLVYRFIFQFNTIYASNDIVDHYIWFFCVTLRNFKDFSKIIEEV